MGQMKLTASLLVAVIAGATQAYAADETAPVVKIQQPISLVGHACSCDDPQACACDQASGSIDGCDATAADLGAPAATCDMCGSGLTCDAGCDSGALGAVGCDSAGCDSGVLGAVGCDAAGCDAMGCSGGCAAATAMADCTAIVSVGCASCQSGKSCGKSSTDCTVWKPCCTNLCKGNGFWIRADYLSWWTKDDELPTLVTSSPLGTPAGDAGVLGLPTTTPIYGGSVFDDMRSGGRIQFGYQWNSCYALTGSFWALEDDDETRSWGSDGNPIYARPFFNVEPGFEGEDAQLISLDGSFDGVVRVDTSSELYGGDISLRCKRFCCSDKCDGSSRRMDFLVGYRYLRLREGVRVTEDLTITGAGPFAIGTTIDLFDDFQTTNEFHGADLGAVYAAQHGKWTAEFLGKIALGNVDRSVSIRGSETITVPTLAPVTTSGGLLTQSTNIGDYEDSEFGVLPEFQANLSYAMSCNLSFRVGYTFLFLGDVVRPGDIIDRSVNGTLLDDSIPLSGPERPQFAWNDSDLWAMGLNLGLEYRY